MSTDCWRRRAPASPPPRCPRAPAGPRAPAVGGRAELMRMLAPAGEVYQAGTLSGNPLAVAAALATLELLDEHAYARLASLTAALAAGLREAAGDYPVQVASAPGLLT